MCLIQLAYDMYEKSLIIAANRDEFTVRAAEPAFYWQEGFLAGRDVQAGGTWLGVSPSGRFAAVTNVRHPKSRILGDKSCGDIVKDFLSTAVSCTEMIDELQREAHLYGGFNVLLYDGNSLYHYNNIFDETHKLSSGIYSLSNHSLNTPWPKVIRSRDQFEQLLNNEALPNDFITMMQNNEQAAIADLPQTGVAPEMELNLSSMFINIEGYGTRCTTYVTIDYTSIHFIEQTYVQGIPTTRIEEQLIMEKCLK